MKKSKHVPISCNITAKSNYLFIFFGQFFRDLLGFFPILLGSFPILLGSCSSSATNFSFPGETSDLKCKNFCAFLDNLPPFCSNLAVRELGSSRIFRKVFPFLTKPFPYSGETAITVLLIRRIPRVPVVCCILFFVLGLQTKIPCVISCQTLL